MAGRKISAQAVATDIRSDMKQSHLMEKYGLSDKGLATLLQKLIEQGVVTEAEVAQYSLGLSSGDQVAPPETATEPQRAVDPPAIDPELAEAVVSDVRSGKHDIDIMVRLQKGRDEVNALLVNLVRLGYLSADELEARISGKTIDCPNCHGKVPKAAQRCGRCGNTLPRPSSPASGNKPRGSASGDSSGDTGCAWEDYCDNRRIRGFFAAYGHTAWKCLVSPRDFFSKLPLDAGYRYPSLFASVEVGALVFLWVAWSEFANDRSEGSPLFSTMFLGTIAFLAAIVATPAALYVWSLLVHGTLSVLGGARKGLQATFRVASYSGVPAVFLAIPVIGPLIAGPWGLYIGGIGLRETHGTSTARAFGAILAPSVLMFAIMFGTFMHQSGITTALSGTASAPTTRIVASEEVRSSPSSAVVRHRTEIETRNGSFSVTTPAPLKNKTVSGGNAVVRMEMPLFSTQQGNVGYSVMCIPIVQSDSVGLLPFSRSQDPEKLFDRIRDGMTQQLGGKVLKDAPITLGNLPGREVVIKLDEHIAADKFLKIRMIFARNVLYQLMVETSQGELETPDVRVFLGSFMLSKQ